jgi:hypothetical protein
MQLFANGLSQLPTGTGKHDAFVITHVPKGEMFAPGKVSITVAANALQIRTDPLPDATKGTMAVPLSHAITAPVIAIGIDMFTFRLDTNADVREPAAFDVE